MSKIFTDLSDPLLPDAIEVNFAAEMSIFGRGLPGAKLHAEEDLFWFETGRPTLNGVLLTRITQSDKTYITAKIATMIEYFKARQLSFSWSVGPATCPTNLAAYLEEAGLKNVSTNTALAIDIQAAQTRQPQPAGLTFQEIEDSATLKLKLAIEQEGFEMPEAVTQDYYASYLASGFGKGSMWHHYIGWLHHEPVAIASLLLQAGVAGIYGVATREKVRKQGIGAAITQHMLYEAQKAGYRIAMLSPSEMSERIYRRLGFQDQGSTKHYRWYPGGASQN